MAATVAFVMTEAPLTDSAGVEAARLRAAARTELAATCPSVTYELLARARGTSEAAARQWVKRQRDLHRLITVDLDQTRLPSFQFDADYQLIPAVSDAIGVLVEAGMGSWAVWRWFCVSNPMIGQVPIDLLVAAPQDTGALRALAQRFVDTSRAG